MQKYDVKWNGEIVGSVCLIRKGLYYEVNCSCNLREGLYRLYAEGDRGEVLIGVLCPEGGHYEISRTVCIKSLGSSVRFFCLNADTEETRRFDVYPDRPFTQLRHISNGRFVIKNGKAGIQLAEEISSKT